MKTFLFISVLFGIFCTQHSLARAEKNMIYLIGSLHDLHKQANYNEKDFRRILKKIQPDLILIEYPTDWFDSNGKPTVETLKYLEEESEKDGNRDAQLSWSYCKGQKKTCLPFDMVGRNKFYKENDVFRRLALFENQIHEYAKAHQKDNILDSSNRTYLGCMNQSPKIINSDLCDSVAKLREEIRYGLYLEARSEFAIEDPEFFQMFSEHWEFRNSTMANNICRLSVGYSKVAVVTGYAHRHSLLSKLKNCSSGKLVDWTTLP